MTRDYFWCFFFDAEGSVGWWVLFGWLEKFDWLGVGV